MIVALTGGTGFIGSALARRLLRDGHDVVIITRNGGKAKQRFMEKVGILEADIADERSLKRLTPRAREIDAVVHLAASLRYHAGFRQLARVNVDGTANLLRWAMHHHVGRFLYASSIEAMGTLADAEIPGDESSPCRPVSNYGRSKREAETAIITLTHGTRMNSVIVRLGNVYGPERPSFISDVAGAIIDENMLARCLPLFERRYLSMVHIDDIVDGFMKALASRETRGTFILSGGDDATVGDLFCLVARELSRELTIRPLPPLRGLFVKARVAAHRWCGRADFLDYVLSGRGKRVHRRYSIEKARRELGYNPLVRLDEGVRSIVGTKEDAA